ncbi:hypothetical protein RIVM261_019870 [Rivularia sp. IAM M-261]|nr:hypothetical protein CAL7716_027440 [Calothrix sp. PCC 7716]GJD17031.1 hypothetical protein RIVM261_019870 [Rivularia sp. IAM M-261]
MLYESIANSLIESVNADKETLAYTMVIDTIADANDSKEARKILTQCVKGQISDPDAEERLINHINDAPQKFELDIMQFKTLDFERRYLALNEQLKTTTSQIEKYKLQVKNYKLSAWIPSIFAIISLALAGTATNFAIGVNNSLTLTKAEREELSQKYLVLKTEHEALNKEFAALQSQNQQMLKGNQKLEKAFEPIKYFHN